MFGTAQTTIVVQISDINEPPEFLSSHFTAVVSEGVGVGEELFSGIVAVDRDQVSIESDIILASNSLHDRVVLSECAASEYQYVQPDCLDYSINTHHFKYFGYNFCILTYIMCLPSCPNFFRIFKISSMIAVKIRTNLYTWRLWNTASSLGCY